MKTLNKKKKKSLWAFENGNWSLVHFIANWKLNYNNDMQKQGDHATNQ